MVMHSSGWPALCKCGAMCSKQDSARSGCTCELEALLAQLAALESGLSVWEALLASDAAGLLLTHCCGVDGAEGPNCCDTDGDAVSGGNAWTARTLPVMTQTLKCIAPAASPTTVLGVWSLAVSGWGSCVGGVCGPTLRLAGRYVGLGILRCSGCTTSCVDRQSF